MVLYTAHENKREGKAGKAWSVCAGSLLAATATLAALLNRLDNNCGWVGLCAFNTVITITTGRCKSCYEFTNHSCTQGC